MKDRSRLRKQARDLLRKTERLRKKTEEKIYESGRDLKRLLEIETITHFLIPLAFSLNHSSSEGFRVQTV